MAAENREQSTPAISLRGAVKTFGPITAVDDRGDIRVFDHVLPQDSKAARAIMGVVPQLDNLDIDVTVEDNLAVFARLYRVEDVGATVERGLALARLTGRRQDAV